MPLYEYRCSECDHLEEFLQKMSDPAPATCPACGKEHTMSKEVSLTSFQLKGGGWYKDLYSSTPKDGGKPDSGKPDSGKSDSGKSDSGKSGSGKSDSGKSKSDTKSDSGKSKSDTKSKPATKSSPKSSKAA